MDLLRMILVTQGRRTPREPQPWDDWNVYKLSSDIGITINFLPMIYTDGFNDGETLKADIAIATMDFLESEGA